MTKPVKKTRPDAQREALQHSEREAARGQPENFKDAETAEKVVEIGPDLQDAPIEGLDPSASTRQRGNVSIESAAGEEDPGAGVDDADMRDAMQGEARHARER